jgi:hypothetical protein
VRHQRTAWDSITGITGVTGHGWIIGEPSRHQSQSWGWCSRWHVQLALLSCISMYFLSWLCSIFCLASFVSFGLSELSEICWWYDYIKTRSPLFHLLHGKVHADFNVSCFAALFRARTSEFQCPLCSGLAWEPLVVMCCQKVRLRSSRSEFRGTQEAQEAKEPGWNQWSF